MFNGLRLADPEPTTSWFRRHRTVGVSVTAHLAVLAALAFHNPRVIDLTPTWLAYGEGARAYKMIYFPAGAANDDARPDAARLLLPSRASKQRPHPQRPSKTVPELREITAEAKTGDHDSRAGSPLGTMIDGPITGHEVHVAYPVVYPDPPVDRAELPRDLQGDVVIEVTIDSQGNVVETKIVQAIGHGIDEKIEATLRRWRYQPATLDGTPVASRHDVHFHFPS